MVIGNTMQIHASLFASGHHPASVIATNLTEATGQRVPRLAFYLGVVWS